MSKIKYTLDFQRLATINTKKGPSPVGLVEEFQQNLDGTINLVVNLDPAIPDQIREAIEKNPQMLGITAVPKVRDVLIIATPADSTIELPKE